MAHIYILSLPVEVKDDTHGKEIVIVMERVAKLCSEIVRKNPQGWYGVGRAIADAEAAVPECNYAEVEFAAYLAGLAVRRSD